MQACQEFYLSCAQQGSARQRAGAPVAPTSKNSSSSDALSTSACCGAGVTQLVDEVAAEAVTKDAVEDCDVDVAQQLARLRQRPGLAEDVERPACSRAGKRAINGDCPQASQPASSSSSPGST
jgi:hypothetical protein